MTAVLPNKPEIAARQTDSSRVNVQLLTARVEILTCSAPDKPERVSRRVHPASSTRAWYA